MDMAHKKLYDNGYSHILMDDSTIQILRNEDDVFSPRSVKVWSTLQIELGRPIKEIKDCLAKTRVPLIIKEVALPVPGLLGYQLIRMHTGIVQDKVLANIIEKDNKVIKITFNRELAKDKEFRKYSQLPVANQLKLRTLNMKNSEELEKRFCKQVNTIIDTLFRDAANFVRADYSSEEIIVYIDADGQEQKVSFIYSNKSSAYELVSISISI